MSHWDKATESRRTFLKMTGGAVSAGGLMSMAGCSSDGSSSDGSSSGGSGGSSSDGSSSGGSGGSGGSSSSSSGQNSISAIREKAKEEGEVVMLDANSGNKPLFEQAEEDLGITIKRTRQSSSDIVPRLISEKQAGNHSIDFTGMGNIPNNMKLITGGIYGTLPDYFKENYPNRIKANRGVAEMFAEKSLVCLYNQNQLSDPPSSFEALANSDLRVGFGTTDTQLLLMWERVFGKEKADSLAKKYASHGVPEKSHTTTVEKVYSGEYPIAYGTYLKYIYSDKYKDVVKRAKLNDVRTLTVINMYGPVGGAPHPNAAYLLTDWMLKNSADVLGDMISPKVYSDPQEAKNNDDLFIVDYDYAKDVDWADQTERYQNLMEIR